MALVVKQNDCLPERLEFGSLAWICKDHTGFMGIWFKLGKVKAVRLSTGHTILSYKVVKKDEPYFIWQTGCKVEKGNYFYFYYQTKTPTVEVVEITLRNILEVSEIIKLHQLMLSSCLVVKLLFCYITGDWLCYLSRMPRRNTSTVRCWTHWRRWTWQKPTPTGWA